MGAGGKLQDRNGEGENDPCSNPRVSRFFGALEPRSSSTDGVQPETHPMTSRDGDYAGHSVFGLSGSAI